jgi:hypothetical protein
LLADLAYWGNQLARWRSDLAAGDHSDGDAGQLRGGIDLAVSKIEAIAGELERRARATAYGYVAQHDPGEDYLPKRFAARRLTVLNCSGSRRDKPGYHRARTSCSGARCMMTANPR